MEEINLSSFIVILNRLDPEFFSPLYFVSFVLENACLNISNFEMYVKQLTKVFAH